MILLCCGQISSKHFDALALFALQLESRGHQVMIDQRFMPEDVTKQIKFEAAPFLVDVEDVTPTQVLIIGAEEISEEVQRLLSLHSFESAPPVHVIGDFKDVQTEVNARNKVAYAIGREPDLFDLAAHRWSPFVEGAIAPLLSAIDDVPQQQPGDRSRVLVYLPFEKISENETAIGQLSVIHHGQDVDLHILTNAKGKDAIASSRYAELSVFGYSELPPGDLLHYFDVLAFFGVNIPGERMAVLALNAMGAGKVVIDCTETSAFIQAGAPVVKGPVQLEALSGYLLDTVVRNRSEIGQRAQQADWLKQFDMALLERNLGVDTPQMKTLPREPQTLFLPTNGNGLGHAQRCALIAEEMAEDRAVQFAAFPSCVGLLQDRGFPCVPLVARSDQHTEEFAADLVNYLRLRNAVRAGDQLVFDGGYVFDSVYRTITRLKISAVWIRRGLWRPGQVQSVALERERAFSQVIVPKEAFEELNTDYTLGPAVKKVGPIVGRKRLTADEKTNLRERLSAHFGHSFETLVVTMLGGGVASRRAAQTQFLCSLFAQRRDCLHLVIAWPHAVVANSLYGWENSHVVQTSNAAELCQASDLCISAAGYNSFHELLYAGVPSIFIPQSAPYLDDQERRARAALDRGVAGLALDKELLHLEREVSAFLDGGKSDAIRQALSELSLPDPGNAAAARLIEEGIRP